MEATKPKSGIVVDGSCEKNPGFGEYQFIDISTGKILGHQKFSHTTNNIMEFCGIVHAIKYCRERDIKTIIYSDSVTAISWITRKSVTTSLENTARTGIMWKFITNCLSYLSEPRDGIQIEKWKTKEWGENPADFGKKNNYEKINKNTLRILLEKEKISCNEKPDALALIERINNYFSI